MILLLAVLCFLLLGWYLWWNRSSFFLLRAHRAFQKGDEAGALAAFSQAETAGRLGSEATASYAYLALKNGHTDEAAEVLNRAFTAGRRGRTLKPSPRRLLETYLSLVFWKQGRLDEAVALLEGLLAQGYRTQTLYGNLGFFLLEQGDLTRAETVCLEAADWDPEGKVILDNLASLYLEKDEWAKAAEVYDRLLALEPRFPEAWHGAGWASLKTGDAAEARRRWERALELPFHSLTTVERSAVEAAVRTLEAGENPEEKGPTGR